MTTIVGTSRVPKRDKLNVPTANVPTAIVGPNPLLRESLSRFLHGSAFEIVALASDINELSDSELPHDRDILVIIDGCDHPGQMCGQVERFHERHPMAQLVVLANHCAPEEVTDVLRSGAHGYIATIATCEDFIKSLELVMSGQTIVPSEGVSPEFLRKTAGAAADSHLQSEGPFSRHRVSDARELPKFSERELYILRCLTEGSSNKVIARECDIAEGTVKVHVKAILRKIKVTNRTQAAIWALSNRHLIWPETTQVGTEQVDTEIAEQLAEPPKTPCAEKPQELNGAKSAEHVNGLVRTVKLASTDAMSR